MTEPGPEQREVRRRRDRTIGLVIISVTFVVALAVSWWARRASRPELSKPPAPPTTAGIVGYPKGVDPIKSLAAARNVTERSILRGITAEGVDSDGTVDVSTPTGRVRYVFQSAPGKGPQPKRPAGTLPSRPYCGKQTVHLRKKGLYADPDVPGYPCSPIHYDELPEPRCSMKDVLEARHRAGRAEGSPGAHRVLPRERRTGVEVRHSRHALPLQPVRRLRARAQGRRSDDHLSLSVTPGAGRRRARSRRRPGPLGAASASARRGPCSSLPRSRARPFRPRGSA